MQVHDPPLNPSRTPLSDQPAMNGAVSPPIEPEPAPSNGEAVVEAETMKETKINSPVLVRKERPTRACTVRAKRYVEPPIIELRSRPSKKRKVAAAPVEEVEAEVVSEEEEEGEGEERGKGGHCGKIVTSLLNPPVPEQMPRWNLRAMWELASVLNFINVFRPLLKITAEFSAEELETALITPNDALSYIHIPLLKAIPPVTRMACGRETWVTVLCRKLRDWWHWVAEGDLPIVAAQGAEVEAYKSLDPAVRVLILKALCDIRVEQEDIRNYIDHCMKQGIQLSMFRKERIGGDSHGISYWYEDDAIIGHRLYREIRKVEAKKAKIKGSNVLPSTTFEWETVATNLDEFLDVSEKLFSSKNRTEVSLGKKLKNNYLPEIEKIHKRKEKLLRKQQREALLLDSYVNIDGLAGRSLRDRKPVTYTFDDFDRSISDAIKITKRKLPSPEPGLKREAHGRSEPSANGTWSESSHALDHVFFSPPSPPDYDEMDEDDASQQQLDLDRSNRRRQRPQRYSEREFVGEASYNVRDSDSDDDIVGEAVYDDDYIRQKKRKTASSGSEGDEEYHWSDENGEEEEEEEEEEESYSMSEDSDGPRKPKKLPGRTRRETKLRSVGDLQSGLRRSNRSTRNRINYQQLEQSESDRDSGKQDKSNVSGSHSAGSGNEEYAMESADSEAHGDGENIQGFDQPADEEGYPVKVDEEQQHQLHHQGPSGERNSANQEVGGVGKTRFLDLNEAAPGSGFEDGPSALMKDAGKSDS